MRLLLCLLLLLLAAPLRAQVETALVASQSEAPGRTRLHVHVRLPYPALTFTRSGDGFRARYNVTATLFSADRQGRAVGRVATRTWNRAVEAATFAATRSGASGDRTLQAFDVPPGAYLVRLEVEDEGARRTLTRQQLHGVRDLSGPLALSDVALAEPGGGVRVGAVSSDESAVTATAEAYAAASTRVRASYELLQGGRTLRGTSDLVALREGRTALSGLLSTADLAPGAYRLRVRLATEAGADLASAETAFEVAPAGGLRGLDEAIAQLRYVARERDLREIRAGRTPEERLARYQAFWRRLDPTPGTPRNERQEEYLARVDAANRRFSGTGGWNTDRGGVLIQFGEPEQVERRASSGGSRPHEVWYYPRLGRRFVFVDRGGDQFRLLEPLWDDRSGQQP